MAMTPTRQRNAVSEGTALGLIMCRRRALARDKVRLDLAFEGAWRVWQYRDRFPQVDTDIRRGSDGVLVMTHAGVRKQTANFYWDRSGPEIAIYPRGVWSDGTIDVGEAANWIYGDVPAEGWRELAEDFLRRFKL